MLVRKNMEDLLMKKISVIVPCYNEEEVVNIFYDTTKEIVNKIENYYFEFIFVDDGSRDKTLEKLVALASEHEDVKYITFSRNFGKEAAMYAGLTEADGDYISIVDADLQQRPEVLLEMFNFLINNQSYDCVAAFQESRREGKVLQFFKRCFYGLINKISDVEFVQGASDFRVFKKSVRDAIVGLSENQRFTKGIFSFVGFNTYFMPYIPEERANGVSKWSFVSLFKYAINGIIAFSTLPLKISSFLGAVTIFGSFVYLLIALIIGVNLTTMMLFFIITFFSGVQLLAIGVFSHYMAMMCGEVKKRPVYITKEILDAKKKKNK